MNPEYYRILDQWAIEQEQQTAEWVRGHLDQLNHHVTNAEQHASSAEQRAKKAEQSVAALTQTVHIMQKGLAQHGIISSTSEHIEQKRDAPPTQPTSNNISSHNESATNRHRLFTPSSPQLPEVAKDTAVAHEQPNPQTESVENGETEHLKDHSIS